jgi:hypothetical protein
MHHSNELLEPIMNAKKVFLLKLVRKQQIFERKLKQRRNLRSGCDVSNVTDAMMSNNMMKRWLKWQLKFWRQATSTKERMSARTIWISWIADVCVKKTNLTNWWKAGWRRRMKMNGSAEVHERDEKKKMEGMGVLTLETKESMFYPMWIGRLSLWLATIPMGILQFWW